MSKLRPSERGPGLMVGERVAIGDGVEIGGHVVIHTDTRVGDGCTIQDGAVVGKEAKLGPHSGASRAPASPTLLEEGAVVCCCAVVTAGATIDRGAIVGDHAYVRERAYLGEGSVLGRAAAIGADARIGAGVRIQNTSTIVPGALVEDDVLVGPSVTTTTNDFSTEPRVGEPLRPIALRRRCRIGAAVILMPGVEVGEEAVVGAAALVIQDVPPRTVVIGSPARFLRELRPEERHE